MTGCGRGWPQEECNFLARKRVTRDRPGRIDHIHREQAEYKWLNEQVRGLQGGNPFWRRSGSVRAPEPPGRAPERHGGKSDDQGSDQRINAAYHLRFLAGLMNSTPMISSASAMTTSPDMALPAFMTRRTGLPTSARGSCPASNHG